MSFKKFNKLALIVVFVFVIIQLTSISALRLKDYDEREQRVVILERRWYDPFGLFFEDRVLEAQLNTPKHYKVGAGYVKVAQFTIYPNMDYENVLNRLRFYDLKNNGREIQKSVEIKYLGRREVLIDDYRENCNIHENGTRICNLERVGSHREYIEDWIEWDGNIRNNQTIIIGLFTNVSIGEKVEWIPRLADVEIGEWAVWEHSLEDGLIGWWKLNELNGTLVKDELNLHNGTIIGSLTQGVDGVSYITTPAFRFNGYSTNYVNISDSQLTRTGTVSISAWVKSNTSPEIDHSIFGRWTAVVDSYILYMIDDPRFTIKLANGTVMNLRATGVNPKDGNYHHLVGTYNGTRMAIYVDGVLKNQFNWNNIVYINTNTGGFLRIGNRDYGNTPMNGSIDEVGLWNRSLTQEEVTILYNNGRGCTYKLCDPPLNIILLSPINNTGLPTNTNYFVANVTSNQSEVTITNVSLLINSVINQTNTSGIQGIYNFSQTLTDGKYNWTVIAFGNDSKQYNSINGTLFFTVDSTKPSINITYPNETIDIHWLNENLSLNWSVSDNVELSTCWFEYGGTNTTVDCLANSTTINITSEGLKNLTFYANDTVGNLESKTTTWDYKIFINSRTFNQTTAETSTESYILNLSANSSLIKTELLYNGTLFQMINNSGIWGYTRDLPANISGDQEFTFKFTYGSSVIFDKNLTQKVNQTLFGLCNSTLTKPFLNITFKDEDTLQSINASIPTSYFIYYLGTGKVNKTFTYSETSNNYNYTFCGTPINRNFYVNPRVQYKQGTAYPQRIWEPTTKIYNGSNMVTQTLYLLSVNNGIFVTYQVVNPAGQPLESVDVIISRKINEEDYIVGFGKTDPAGLITFWLNPDFVHTATFSKSGLNTLTLNHFPTQSSYTIVLGLESEELEDLNFGVYYSIQPTVGSDLEANTNVNFNFTINSTYWNLTEFKFTLYNQENEVIGGNFSTNPDGGIISNIINVSNYSKIIMVASWTINGKDITLNFQWNVFDSSSDKWSIKSFFNDLSNYANQGIFGLNKSSLSLIIFIIIFTITGIVSYKFSLTSPAVTSGIVFALVFLFNVGLDLLPGPPNAGKYFPTFLFGMIMLAFLIKEVTS